MSLTPSFIDLLKKETLFFVAKHEFLYTKIISEYRNIIKLIFVMYYNYINLELKITVFVQN